MGQAKRRGTFEERKAQAVLAGRDPEANRRARKQIQLKKAAQKLAYLDYLRQRAAEQAKAISVACGSK